MADRRLLKVALGASLAAVFGLQGAFYVSVYVRPLAQAISGVRSLERTLPYFWGYWPETAGALGGVTLARLLWSPTWIRGFRNIMGTVAGVLALAGTAALLGRLTDAAFQAWYFAEDLPLMPPILALRGLRCFLGGLAATLAVLAVREGRPSARPRPCPRSPLPASRLQPASSSRL